jgi:hypothetical protein
MYNDEKRLASAKCDHPKNDLPGALISSEETGSVTASQAPLREPISHSCLHNDGCHLKPLAREFVSDIAPYQAAGRPPPSPQSDWLREICARLKGRAYERD